MEIDKLFDNIESIESKMFNCLKYRYYRYYITLSNNVRIWTISNVKPTTDKNVYSNNKIDGVIDINKEPILLLHGYMASAGFWILNFDSLTQSKHPIYAIDLPGYSRSSRIEIGSNHIECENIYIEIIQELISYLNINKLTIIGHSMGGYLASSYTLKYQNQVKNLILVDPWGYEDIKEAIVDGLVKCSWVSIFKEIFNWRHYFRIIGLSIAPYSYFSLFRTLGESFTVNILSLCRPSFKKFYTNILSETNDINLIYKYIHHNTSCQYNTGELFMPIMCVKLGWSLRPMLFRILNTYNSPITKNTSKILFIYGENSWVNKYPGFHLKQYRTDLDVQIKIIKNVGHQVVFENPEEFLIAIKDYL